MADLDALISLGKDPIPGDNPAGSSVQYDDDYEAMRAEVQKLDSVEQEPVDWNMVVDACSDILRSRSKHMLVTVYMTVGLFELNDYRGLATGLTVLRDLLATFWENMEPPLKRKRGRIEAIFWLAERGGRAVLERKPVTDEKEPLESCAALMKELTSSLTEKLGDDAPPLGDLQRAVQEHLSDFEAAVRAAEAAKAAAAARAAAGEVELNTPEDARKILAKNRTTIKMVCDFLRKADNSDPVPYRLIRAITWGQLKEPPPNTDGGTQIPAPPAEQAARLADLHLKQEWANLIEGSEATFGAAVFWLDLHRWAALALAGLGPTHQAACDAVVFETAMLITRLPDLTKLKFANGTPFASSDTVMWLDSDVKSRLGGAGDGASPVPTGGGDNAPEGLAETTGDARRLASGGNLPQAIRMMQEGISSTGERRGQFLWRLGLARLCLDSGKPMLATPHLEELDAMIQQHGLEFWDPQLCLMVYTALLTARRALLKDQRRATPELVLKTNDLQDRLCRLDAATALSMAGR